MFSLQFGLTLKQTLMVIYSYNGNVTIFVKFDNSYVVKSSQVKSHQIKSSKISSNQIKSNRIELIIALYGKYIHHFDEKHCNLNIDSHRNKATDVERHYLRIQS